MASIFRKILIVFHRTHLLNAMLYVPYFISDTISKEDVNYINQKNCSTKSALPIVSLFHIPTLLCTVVIHKQSHAICQARIIEFMKSRTVKNVRLSLNKQICIYV